MTGSERVLARLHQGPATASELYAETRCMVHSRVADLRRRGYVITCDKTRDYEYRLLGEPDGAGRAAQSSEMGVTSFVRSDGPSVSPSEPVQLSLVGRGAYGDVA